MPIYRFYSIKKDGHIGGPAALHDLVDDAAAVQMGKTLLADLDIEIWLCKRVVGYLKAQDATAARQADAPVAEGAAAPAISRS